MTTQTVNKTERDAAMQQLLDATMQTNKIYGTVRSVNRSGSRRIIHFWTIKNNEPIHLDHTISLIAGYKMSQSNGPWGLVVDGGGMDMIFSVVHDVSQYMAAAGFTDGSTFKYDQL